MSESVSQSVSQSVKMCLLERLSPLKRVFQIRKAARAARLIVASYQLLIGQSAVVCQTVILNHSGDHLSL